MSNEKAEFRIDARGRKVKKGFRIAADGKQVPETRGKKKMKGARRHGMPTSVSDLERRAICRIAEGLGVKRSELMYTFFREGLDRIQAGQMEAAAAIAPRRPLVYLSTPVDADTTPFEAEQLTHQANAMAAEAWRMGCVVVAPGFQQGRLIGGVDRQIMEEGNHILLLKCDAVLMAPGWQTSETAMKERARSELAGKPAFVSMAKLAGWLEQNEVAQPKATKP